MVHTHLPVDCGPRKLCASASVRVRLQPRDVQVRLRYHRDGELAFDARTVYNVVGAGAPHNSRSLIVYGVFDETNRNIQWRGRHQFPTIRKQEAERLGLRRQFTVEQTGFGSNLAVPPSNAYGYGVRCPDRFQATGFGPVTTLDRAVFDDDPLPLGGSDAEVVCGQATVTDGTSAGTFTTGAIALKNPEVRQAFPELNSPVQDALVLPFFLQPCEREISADHEEMQRQRLLIGNLPPICTDDWEQPDFLPGLVDSFRDAIREARPIGRDMVLVVGLHQDQDGLSEVVEEALSRVVPQERHRTTPRVAGAFVFDSTTRGPTRRVLGSVTLWCPATLPTGTGLPDLSSISCPVLPDNLGIELGPLDFGTLPILAPRDQYLDFIDTYSKAQAGEVLTQTFRTPEFAASAEHLDFGEFGVVTFLNNEHIEADPDDAFSWCAPKEPIPVVFQSELAQQSSGYLEYITEEECLALGFPPELCALLGPAPTFPFPIDALPEWHNQARESEYDLGVYWEFPFLLRMEYEAVAAGAITGFGVSVPFGVRSTTEQLSGTAVWLEDTVRIGKALLQCERFCDFPTFDSASVYHPTDPFRETYRSSCYLPAYPQLTDDGFPFDP
jgi:hypothetical protein